jgi:phosphoglycerol transferase MdoB-like AlkP superfamily enzyme
MPRLSKKHRYRSAYAAALSNMALMMLLFSVCRLLFFALNREFFPDTSADQIWLMLVGGLRFDLSALLWGNIAYIVLLLIPLKLRYSAVYQAALKVLFVAVNAVLLLGNCADTVAFKITLRRATADVFQEFASERNLGKLIGHFAIDFWYVLLIWLALSAAVALLYRKARRPRFKAGLIAGVRFYATAVVALALAVLLSVAGMRSGFTRTTRPITLSNAGEYVKRPLEVCIVQNTPFCIFRTIGKKIVRSKFFDSQQALEQAYNPVVAPVPKGAFKPMNVVIIIWESLSREHVGSLNKHLENGAYKGFTPFVDTLIAQGLTFTASYANGRKSIEAMPSVLAGVPSLHVPFFLSPYSGNQVNSVASLLKKKGYGSTFFHGSTSSTMGFWAFAKMAGFDAFYGEDAYGNRRDHDGTWGIWDEEFLQFMALKLSEQPQPFCSAVFTISSHHPFKLPKRYKDIFPEESDEQMLKCMRYTDHALRRFFETARQQPWYANTLFVLTADHANKHIFPESQNDADQMAVPIVLFTPDGSLRGVVDNVAQQTDILPTIMGILSYDEPFVAFGQDALDQAQEHFAINFLNGVYHVYYKHYLLLFDGEKTTALYDLQRDRMMQRNLAGQHEAVRLLLESKAKGFMQQYNNRMIDNCLTIDCSKLQAP